MSFGIEYIASQCPNKKEMIEVVSDHDSDSAEEDMLLIGDSEENIAPQVRGDIFMIKQALNMQVKPEDNSQRENIFHSRCLIKGKLYSLIIDRGSCTNLANIILVDKAELTCTKHHNPYKLHQFGDNKEVKVTKKVQVLFFISKYEDEVLCDVVSMQAGHILLARPWQYDMSVNHNSGKKISTPYI